LFSSGAADGDLAVIDGAFGRPRRRYEALCRWLHLPKLAVVDVQQLDACNLPARPDDLGGVILHRIPDTRTGLSWRLAIESQWGTPVLGMVEQTRPLDELVRRVRSLAPQTDQAEMTSALLDCLRPKFDIDALFNLAAMAPPMPSTKKAAGQFKSRPPVIAVAFDEAIHGYFPDTFDALEQCGADVASFSPLRSESLPEQSDIVYLGSGPVADYADALASNRCLQASLRDHVRRGGRVYAEGGGVAMLAQAVVTPRGAHPMSGALPLVAHAARTAAAPKPVATRVGCKTWLGPGDQEIRAYRSGRWHFGRAGQIAPPTEPSPVSCDENADWIVHEGVVATRFHLHFAASPQWLAGFLTPSETWV
jgi:cobyrinic acid a,c-diamide synthase